MTLALLSYSTKLSITALIKKSPLTPQIKKIMNFFGLTEEQNRVVSFALNGPQEEVSFKKNKIKWTN